MTVLHNCVLVSELEARLYHGAVRKCRAYRGKIVTSGGKSYICLDDLLPRHLEAARGLEVIDRAVPLHQLYEEIPGLSKRDAFKLIAGSRRANIAGDVIRRKHGVYVRVDEETSSLFQRMTAFAVRTLEEAALATRRTTIGNIVIGFY